MTLTYPSLRSFLLVTEVPDIVTGVIKLISLSRIWFLLLNWTLHLRHISAMPSYITSRSTTTKTSKLCIAGPLWVESIFDRWITLQRTTNAERVFPRHEFITNHSLCSRLLNGILHYREAEMKPSARRLGDVEVRLYSDLHESSNDVISNIPKENI